MRSLKELILKEFKKKGSLKTADLARAYKVTYQAIQKHLSALIKEGRIIKLGSSKRGAYYALNTPQAKKKVLKGQRKFTKKVRAEGLDEDILLKEVASQAGILDGLSRNVRINFDYAFTEMVNNAIDHSKTRFIDIGVEVNPEITSFSVSDTGVGIFQNICEKLGLGNELEAVQDLLKGKQTTMPERHTGEGVFFTSKVADRFIVESHKKRLVIDNNINDIFIEDIRFKKGTRVVCEIRSNSQKKLDEIFSQYTKENFKFGKSQVEVKLFTQGELYVSRSQAKRIVHALDQFEEIVLDFKDVETIGQAFADEVFRVFQNDHPEIKLIAINCNENVDFMIKRALSGSI